MEGFLVVQKVIDFALLSLYDVQVNNIELMLKRFPYGPYVHDNFIVILIAIFPYIVQLSFIFIVIFTSKAIVQEKETGLKEYMKLMGMKSNTYWFSWYIKILITIIPSVILMVISFKMKITLCNGAKAAILDKSNWFIIGMLFFLYSSSLATFILMCTTFFKKSSNASTGTALIYFITFMPHIYLSLNYENLNSIVKFFSCFVNNLGMCLGIHIISLLEGIGIGVQFENFKNGVYADEKFSLFDVMIIMFVNNFIHLFVMYYCDNVFPGNHGIPKPWYFVFTKKKPLMNLDCKNLKKDETKYLFNFEDESIYYSKEKSLEIRNVSKSYRLLNGQIIKSVDNLSLTTYTGQITVLLGQNGAGKR